MGTALVAVSWSAGVDGLVVVVVDVVDVVVALGPVVGVGASPVPVGINQIWTMPDPC
jgi:hypothetical protein